MISAKFKFEDNPKIYDFELKAKDNFVEYQARLVREVLNTKDEAFYYLYNPETLKFVEQTSDIPKYKNVFVMKNTSKEAQSVVEKLKMLLSSKRQNEGKLHPNQTNELKSLVFALSNYLTVDSFSEEFISFGGLESLIEAIQESTGNTRSYAINSLKSILVYKNAIEYIRENTIVVTNLYYILMNISSAGNSETAIMSIISHTLGILLILCELLRDEGVTIIYKAAENYSEEKGSKIFKELVQLLFNNDIQIKINTMTLVFIMVKCCNKKSKQAKILAHLNEAELMTALMKYSDLKSEEFQIQLTNFQKLTGEVLKGSNYEVQLYKAKYKDIENHCLHLERKVEYIFLSQKYYSEVIEDFIGLQQMAETASEIGGFFDPSKFYKFYTQTRLLKDMIIDCRGA